MNLLIKIIPVTAFAQNCSVIICQETRQAAVVDPGGELEKILAVIEQEQAILTKILVTHAHIDHAGAVAELQERTQLPIEGPQKEEDFWIQMLPKQGQMFGFPPAKVFTPTRWLEDGDEVAVGNTRWQVRHCPGHTPGHIIFFNAQAKRAIVGDVLFAGSIGRTDFPRGNHAQLVQSIREKLWPLGDDVVFFPGHGPESTFGQERKTNPFVRDGV